MILFLILCIVFMTTFAIRVYPVMQELNRGTDAYVFLMYREALLKQKKLPVRFPPVFVLENAEMWYPPGFAIFLACLPNWLIDRYHALISPAMDALINSFLFLLIQHLFGDLYVSFICSLLFAVSPAVIPEACTMTSRQLGNLFLNLSVLSLFYWAENTSQTFILVLSLFSTYLLLMTHKLSTQAFCLGIPTVALLTSRADLIAVFIAGFITTVVFSFGFYIKILRGHFSYVAFHSKNWHYVSAHMVEDSPIYGKTPGRNSPYGKGLQKSILFTNRFLLENAYVVAAVFVILETIIHDSFSNFVILSAVWCLAVLGWALLIYWLPFLRGIGFASQYGKLAMPAGLICVAAVFMQANNIFILLIALTYTFYCLYDYFNFTKKIQSSFKFHKWDPAVIDPLLEYTLTLDNPLILTIPLSYSDLIAYKTNQRVLWGGHNYPASLLTPVYPILRKPLETLCQDHGVTHILVDNRYTDPKKLGLVGSPLFQAGYVEVYQAKC